MNSAKSNELAMRCYVDLGEYWPDGLSVNAAYESLLIKGWKVDRRTLTAAKKGELIKSDYSTLIHLRNWTRELTKKPDLTIDELLTMEVEETEE